MSLGLALLISPFLIQAAMTFFDEFYFHHKRGLPLWERLGHPLDTITVLACYLFVVTREPTATNIKIYIALVVFSCIFITKDEFVHTTECKATEQWLHSMLFVTHPLILVILSLYWFKAQGLFLVTESEFLLFQKFIKGQVILVSIFLTYQILYWNISWEKLFSKSQKSTTNTTTT